MPNVKSNPRIKKSTRPGPGRPTREQARLRNLELLDRALELFAEYGFERTTMEGIAASVGMAKRTVYAQYGDKLNLFKAALQRAINAWIIPVAVLREAETDDIEETLMNIGNILVDNILTPEGLRLLRITNTESSRLPEISNYTYEQGTGPTLAFLAEMFSRRIPHTGGRLVDENAAALAFLYLIVGGPANQMVWGVPMSDDQITRHTRYCVKLFLYGVLSEHVRPG